MKYKHKDKQMADGLIKTPKPDEYSKWRSLIGPIRGGELDMDREDD